MAASAGTNPGSMPVGVGVGVGDGDSLAEGVADGDASGEGEAVGVDVGAGLTAAVGVHPPRRMAIAATGRQRAILRNGVPTVMDIGRGRPLGACALRRRCKKLLPYALGICHTLTAKMR